MNKHLYIYSPIGTAASALGWILQQSTSYSSDYFVFKPELLQSNYVDPWDNHVDFHKLNLPDPDSHWIFQYTKCIERDDTNFEWLDSFVNGFSNRSAFGLSYGGWEKLTTWNNPKVTTIVVKRTVELFDYFWKIYMSRPFSVDDVKRSLMLHHHDHKNHISGYYEWLIETVGNDAIEQAKHTPVRFWQLQAVYHNGGSRFPLLSEEQHWKDIVYGNTSASVISDNQIEVDIFNLDFPNLCDTLDIDYNEKITQEYNTFLNFAKTNK